MTSLLLEERAGLPAGTSDAVVERLFPAENRWRNDPVGYVHEVLGFEPWSKQREILEAVRDHKRVAVRSCHGIGKTAVAARVALWFLLSHPGDTRVITTGASWDGVKKLLWKEIHEAHWRSGGRIGGKLTETELILGGAQDNPKWFATGLSTDKPERFQGHHADHLLLIVDEASGVDERIFEAATGYMTNPQGTARLLLIGNPTQLAGEFYAAFHSRRSEYHTIHVSAFDTPAFTGEQVSPSVLNSVVGREWVEDMRRLYGEDSSVWQVRVLGDFPSITDDTVCSLAHVEAARKRQADLTETPEPVVIGCDVARFGSDETVITTRQGPRVRVARTYTGRDLMQTVGHVLDVARSYAAETRAPKEFVTIVIDDPGVGGGVTDRLREKNEFRIVAFSGGQRARRPLLYPNRRSELWFTFAEQHLPGLDLDDDEQLAADLIAPKYTLDSDTRRVVERKKETKKRLGRSPDRADAVLLTFAAPPAVAPAAPLTNGAPRYDAPTSAYAIRREM